jgi:hypothetical protein
MKYHGHMHEQKRKVMRKKTPCMIPRITGFLNLVHYQAFCKTQKNTAFQKLDLFPSSERWKKCTLLERTDFNQYTWKSVQEKL